ncbi:MAG TPA: hypothetical protein VGQ58_00080 [Candidatus Limnocylindrales bacterium]|jgi:hypothetical protein|nr:hypothetical protein [Candidatus Limnocylindrales bacterium]
MTRRFLTGGSAAIATLLLAAGTTAAGGWATITADEGSGGDQPRAGETDEFGFTVLQHGQTPAGWVTATLVVENSATGETIRVPATPQGADGHFVAKVRFPEAGYWIWRVDITDLIPESPPRMLTVLTADGALPPFDPSTALTMVERAKADLRAEFQADYAVRIDGLESALSAVQSRASSLERERDAMSERLVAAENGAGGGVPIAATLAVAVLGGALAGFAMAGLGRRATRPESNITAVPDYVTTTQ